MLTRPSEQRHPFTALIILMAISLGGLVIFVSIAQGLGFLFFGVDILAAMQSGSSTVAMQKLFISCYSIGAFVLPPFIYARIRSKTPFDYLDLRTPQPVILLLMALLVMISFSPFLEWTIYLNQQMKLPLVLEKVETWMKYKEIEAEMLTKQLLVMKSIGPLVINMVVIAIIPAVGEELLFRGCIQKIAIRWTANPHLGIWIAAIIFSAIHFQFYGFVPRMLLGALFGYLFYFSKSIWVPIFAHFYNNASAVIAAYVLQQQGKSVDDLTKPEPQQDYLVLLSVIFTALFFYLFYRTTLSQKRVNDE
jgi:uncharacterized protein